MSKQDARDKFILLYLNTEISNHSNLDDFEIDSLDFFFIDNFCHVSSSAHTLENDSCNILSCKVECGILCK